MCSIIIPRYIVLVADIGCPMTNGIRSKGKHGMHTKHNEVYTLSLSTGMKHDNVIVMVITLVPLVEQSNKKSAII